METSRFTRRAASLGVFGLLWVVTIGFACPEKCDCTSDGWVRCNARGLEAVPISIPVNATRLYLNDNNIQNLTDTDFSNLTSLRHLDLSNNDIRVLPGGVFSNLTRLWLLDLADNHITHLPDGIFSNLISLALLYLKSNHISSLPAGVFSYLTNLDQLYLSGNNLADLADGVFSQLTSLVYLYLDDNEISSLSDEVLSNLTLRSLDLSYNRITSLPDGVSSYITDDVRRDLRLAGNPWRCDCSFQRQLTSESLRTLIADDPTCSSPPHMEGQNLKRVESDTVCQHRGDCTTGRSDGSCACKVSWTGTYCEKEANLALGKKATSSTGIYGRPEKAVDGSWEECAVTSRWWKVDLGAYYVVNRVRAVSSGKLVLQGQLHLCHTL
ncbi:chondroadherin-like [Branchiostoma lanceolatum]|uniref:chondroadherin-like n=1 Tax=Branchiostoma lanceolatum TaxID=7740 RepID=UPI003455A70E